MSWVGPKNEIDGIMSWILIQCFEWERIDEDDMESSSVTNLDKNKEKPGETIFRPRGITTELLSQL